uniref:Uncharacterized protein n=1 Tax=Caenorhabditis japonica TaxID=281687 RepID=A0A8R1EJG0_CAEJA
MYSSFFHNSGVKIYANRVMCDNGQDEQRCRIDTLDELLANASSQRDGSNGFEKSLVLCRSNATCRTATVMIHTAKKHKTCIFTSDMYAESCCIADQEREKFLNGTGFVGMASGEAFEMIGLPPVQHYVFLEFPQLLKRFASLIKQFEAKATDESRPIRIDVIASQYDDIACLKALTVEMDVRRNPLPEWLTDIVL